jgi:transposase InsO family protein
MSLHANAKLGLAGRRHLDEAIDAGMTLRQAAARFSVSPATARRWWHRWRDGDRGPDALLDRSSRPYRQPRRLSVAESSGSSRPAARRTSVPAGWPGSCVVLARPSGRCSGGTVSPDDHEVAAKLPPLRMVKDAETNVRTLQRALRFLAELGLDPPEALMTDNAMVYRNSHRLRELLERQQIRHIRIPPYTPRWNGKVERFIQTLQNEWAYSRTWPNSHSRARSLQSFIRYYNRQRPHSSLQDRPPASRIHNVCGQDS